MTPLLQVHDLSLRFGGVLALNQVQFAVAPGSITALIGPNGAGKTTVFNCLTGFYHPDTGSAHFAGTRGGVDLFQLLGAPLSWQRLRRPQRALRDGWAYLFGGSHRIAQVGVARTFQNIRLFREMTVLENLLVAQHHTLNCKLLSGVIGGRAYRQAEQQGLARAYHWLEFCGLGTTANRLAGELPYGHQRLLEIARALCLNPQLLCLDEPAAGLNPRETQSLGLLLQRLRSECGLTLLLIEHDMPLVMSLCDTVIVLDYGVVIASGSPQAVSQNPAVLAAYLGTEDLAEATEVSHGT